MKLYNLYKILNEDEELFFFKDEWYPTNKDWYTMIMNLNNHASLDNIFRKIYTFNIDKMVRCYKVAQVIGWPNLDKYVETIRKKFIHDGGLFYDEFEIMENKFIELPEDFKNLILDFEENDNIGGIVLRHQDLGDFSDDHTLFNALEKYLKYDIKSIRFYKLPLDSGNFNPNIRIIKFVFNNGSIAYFKITKWNSNCYNIKCCDYEERNINAPRFQTMLQIYTAPYIDGIKTDSDYLIQTL